MATASSSSRVFRWFGIPRSPPTRWAKPSNLPHEALRRCADWLLTKEVRRKGDWSVKRPNTEPSGWYFEFANEFYPDIDDTAMVLLALSRSSASRSEEQQACEHRAIHWLLAMQSKDGGWAAFDVDNNWSSLSCVPFADHNAMLDPTCPDITGRVMEALSACGYERSHPAIAKGVEYLMRTQEEDGSWYGRWGVNYIYGTFLALRGLEAAGVSDREAYVQRGARMGAFHSELRRRLGRKLRQLRRRASWRGEHSFANRLGDSGPAGRRRHHQLQPAERHRIPDSNAEAATEPGTRSWPPEPAFRRSFI